MNVKMMYPMLIMSICLCSMQKRKMIKRLHVYGSAIQGRKKGSKNVAGFFLRRWKIATGNNN